jgi:uncharacterized Ntn-hydrolase superfamily protein
MTVIVGRDPDNDDLGIAVARKFLAIGALAPHARAGVGAIATLGYRINTSYGPRGLDLLASGAEPEEIVRRLTHGDELAGQRQLGIVGAQGGSTIFTGADLTSSQDGWAGGVCGPNVVAMGSRLQGEATVTAMADTFERTSGPLWERLVAALDAGQRMGGDIRERRQQHAAALLVVRQGGGRGGLDDRLIDLRVDDHEHPVAELHRLLEIHEYLFLPCDPADLVPVDEDLARALQAKLAFEGDYQGSITGAYDAATRVALEQFAARENLEERLQPDGRIDPKVLERLQIRR